VPVATALLRGFSDFRLERLALVITAIRALAVGLALASGAHAEPLFQALAHETVGTGQGVLVVAEDGTVLAEEAAERAVHPASVTKIATTLAMLQRLGPEHRFTTRFAATGELTGGTLHGDLVVEASGDPFLVDEGACLILRRLHALGLKTVAGALAVRGPLIFDWARDPTGSALVRTLRGKAGDTAWAATSGSDATLTLREAALVFLDRRDAPAGAATPLAVYRSPPLLAMLKALNGYSNNVFHFASDAIGGPAAVAAMARASVPPALRDQVVITNAAGAGTENRISPRAAVALLRALTQELAHSGHDLTAVLPVSGIDPGTLRERLLAAPAGRGMLVGKTGTYGSEGASALAGALRTARFGTVTFAVLNRNVPVPEARRRQDAFVTALVAATSAGPWPYDTAAPPAFAGAQVE
jgi:D-alanyl-D-alanine carboxypeptidase/D-alanyl-D-alanine-endopeptidase (penicillin-binding protein 4)